MIAVQLSFEITVQLLKSQSAAYLIQQRLYSQLSFDMHQELTG